MEEGLSLCSFRALRWYGWGMNPNTTRILNSLVDGLEVRGAYGLLVTLGLKGQFRVLDLGCGEGDSSRFFSKRYPKAVWRGVDIADSDEAKKRRRGLKNVDTFNGVQLPYSNGAFDLVFCNQVLEHVRHPDLLVSEVVRVLKPGGLFIGEVSYLEPYHSRSIFNFSPYGCIEVLESAGLGDVRLCPSRDALMVILRSFVGASNFKRIPGLSGRKPTFMLIDWIGRLRRTSEQERALKKLLFSGSFSYAARKDTPIGADRHWPTTNTENLVRGRTSTNTEKRAAKEEK
jgi:SAM-dependent methyltransferase